MHCHVCHEGIASNGANNVEYLNLNTLTDANNENGKGGDLNIVFENCSGQNKNNIVLRLICYLLPGPVRIFQDR